MSVEEYFTTVILVLKGLTLIAFILIFLYMIFGKKEEGTPSASMVLLGNLSSLNFLWVFMSLLVL